MFFIITNLRSLSANRAVTAERLREKGARYVKIVY